MESIGSIGSIEVWCRTSSPEVQTYSKKMSCLFFFYRLWFNPEGNRPRREQPSEKEKEEEKKGKKEERRKERESCLFN